MMLQLSTHPIATLDMDFYVLHVRFGEVLSAALPSALLLQSESIISMHPDAEINEELLSDDQFLVVEALQQEARLKVEDVHAF